MRKKKINSKKKIIIASNIAKELIRKEYKNHQEFARAHKINVSSMYRVMAGENYSMDMLLRIADSLEIDAVELLRD